MIGAESNSLKAVLTGAIQVFPARSQSSLQNSASRSRGAQWS